MVIEGGGGESGDGFGVDCVGRMAVVNLILLRARVGKDNLNIKIADKVAIVENAKEYISSLASQQKKSAPSQKQGSLAPEEAQHHSTWHARVEKGVAAAAPTQAGLEVRQAPNLLKKKRQDVKPIMKKKHIRQRQRNTKEHISRGGY
jgi:hypothetical protein